MGGTMLLPVTMYWGGRLMIRAMPVLIGPMVSDIK